jgi:hypothetical protein
MSEVSLKQRLQDKIETVRKEWDTSRNPSARVLNQDQYVRLTFQRLDLDVEKPEDQTLLLFALGRFLHSGQLRPPYFLNTLMKDAQAIVKKEGLTGGKREAVRRLRLADGYRDKYAKYTENTLLKYMNEAVNRNKNPYYDELANGLPVHVLPYNRTVFLDGARIVVTEVPPQLEAVVHPPQRAKQLREGSPRRSKRTTIRHPILKWLEGRLYIVVYRSL